MTSFCASLIAQAGGAGSLLGSPALMMVAMVAIFYMLVWRPQQKQINDAKRLRDGLKSGDRVITAGGLYGRIVEVDAESVLVEVASKTRLRVVRSQIVKHQAEAAEAAPVEDEKK